MDVKFLDIINNQSKDSIIKFLEFIKKEYIKKDDISKNEYVYNLKEEMLYMIFLIYQISNENSNENKNCFFLSIKDFYLVICFKILTLKKDFLKSINKLIKFIKDEYLEIKGYNISDKVVEEIVNLAEDRYELLTILENYNAKFYFLNIPFVNKYAETYIDEIQFDNAKMYAFELFGVKDKKFPIHYSFAYSLGRCLYYYVQEKAPSILESFASSFEVNSTNLADCFAEAFSVSLLYYTKYDTCNIDPLLKEKYVRFFEKIFPKLHKLRKLNRNNYCPCGSGKLYKDCCENKDLVWQKDNKKIVKTVPLKEDVNDSLKVVQEDFKKIFGRYPYGYEKIFNMISSVDMNYDNIFSILPDSVDLKIKYAVIKTGMFLTSFNYNQYTDLDLEEWDDAIKEFKEINNKKLSNNKSLFENVQLINDKLSYLDEYINNVIYSLNLINNSLNNYEKYFDVSVKNRKDFAVVCSHKIGVDANILLRSLKDKSLEEVTNISRIIYEDLILLDSMFSNKELFEEKIVALSLLDENKLMHKKNSKGEESKYILVDPKTKKEYNIKINIKELSDKSKYGILYRDLFDGLSTFIHLRISKASHYFKIYNPLTEVAEEKTVALLGLFLLNQCLYEIKKNKFIDKLLLRDIDFVYMKNSDYIKECLAMLNVIEKNNNIYDFMSDTLKKCTKNINREHTIILD